MGTFPLYTNLLTVVISPQGEQLFSLPCNLGPGQGEVNEVLNANFKEALTLRIIQEQP